MTCGSLLQYVTYGENRLAVKHPSTFGVLLYWLPYCLGLRQHFFDILLYYWCCYHPYLQISTRLQLKKKKILVWKSSFAGEAQRCQFNIPFVGFFFFFCCVLMIGTLAVLSKWKTCGGIPTLEALLIRSCLAVLWT